MNSKPCRIPLKDFGALTFENLELQVATSSEPPEPRSRLKSGNTGNLKLHPPKPDSDVSATTPASQSHRAPSPLPATPRPACVLIVDDELSIREALAKVLRLHGYDVRLAQNGDEALARFEPDPPDVVLLDLNMPVKNGWDALGQMIALNPRQAVILITGHRPELSWAGTIGTGTLIEKPIDVDELLGSMTKMLTEPEPQRARRVELQRTLMRLNRPLTNLHWCVTPHPCGGINE